MLAVGPCSTNLRCCVDACVNSVPQAGSGNVWVTVVLA